MKISIRDIFGEDWEYLLSQEEQDQRRNKRRLETKFEEDKVIEFDNHPVLQEIWPHSKILKVVQTPMATVINIDIDFVGKELDICDGCDWDRIVKWYNNPTGPIPEVQWLPLALSTSYYEPVNGENTECLGIDYFTDPETGIWMKTVTLMDGTKVTFPEDLT